MTDEVNVRAMLVQAITYDQSWVVRVSERKTWGQLNIYSHGKT